MSRLNMLLLLPLSALCSMTMAQEVTVETAKGRVVDFLSSQSAGPKHAKGTLSSTDLKLAYTSTSEGKTCFYVFNVGDDDGFVIAGGDEVAHEILGFSDHGSFDYDTAPDNFRWWLGQYTEQIAHAEAPSDETLAATAAYRAKAAQTRASIAPLIETTWNQDEPYNSEIPIYHGGGEPYYTGCVATAMAQVMNYHRCPKTNGMGSHSYKIDNHVFSADFGATTYDWDNMQPSYKGVTDATQQKAVGTLMYHAGVSVNMKYGVVSSNAYSKDIGAALVKYFGYDKSVRNEFREYYSEAEWEDMVYNELAAERPVLYSGSAESGAGHQFICDGYDSEMNKYYINWGWGGLYDGYFVLTGDDALHPFGSGIGGNGKAYDHGQMIVLNVMQDKGGAVSHHFVLQSYQYEPDAIFLKIDKTTYEDNYFYDKSIGSQSCYLNYFFINASCLTNNSTYYGDVPRTAFDFGYKVVEQGNGNVNYIKVLTGAEIYTESGLTSTSGCHTTIDLNTFEYNGVYEFHPVYCLSGTDDWIELDVPVTETIPTVTVTGAKNRKPSEVTFTIENSMVYVGRTLPIHHDSNYNGTITYSSSDEQVATVDDQGVITGVSEGSAVITVKCVADPEHDYLATERTFAVDVKVFAKKDFAFTLEETKVDTYDNILITWTDGYDGELTFQSSDENIATVNNKGKITGVAKGKVEITAKAAETDNFKACEATFTIEVIELKISIIEEPHFNNDNNPYEDDFVLYVKVRNDCEVDHKLGFMAEAEIDKYTLTKTPSTSYTVSPGRSYLFQSNFNTLLTLMKSRGDSPEINKQYKVNLYMTNGQPFADYSTVTFTYRDKLALDYGVSPAGYGTLILPFNADVPEGMTVYSCTEVDANGVLNLQEESSIVRNVPYIVKATYGSTYHFEGPEAIDADKPSFQQGILVGAVTDNVPLQQGTDYILQNQDGKVAFYRYTGTKSDNQNENDAEGNRLVKQFRAFLRLPAATNAPKLSFPGDGDEPEGITTLTAGTPLPSGIYSIDGKRQSNFQKGLNILILDDGTARKVFVR